MSAAVEARAAAWRRILSERSDAVEALADVEARLPFEFSAIASAERRGDVEAWARAVLDAFARLDSLRSERLCGDCGAENVATVAPGLTGGRVCARCLRESLAATAGGEP